jgi:hypothetical protein
MRAMRWVAATLAVAAVVAGCLPINVMRQPRAGQVAPPVEGVDSDGRAMSLREYRGQVVLLSFWHSS